ncbi:MAG: sodium-dependent transporter, partial [Roseburia sp.]|nr:sodium-dependent transporter [Roseburia sp.]
DVCSSDLVFMLIFLAITAFVVYCGVEKGIEKFSKIIMPLLLVMIVGIAIFSLTLSYTDNNGVTRTGLQGLSVYLVPNFEGLTFGRFLEILLDAMSQLFFSLSVSMGIMITYGSYVKKDVNLSRSVAQIEIFDTGVALIVGAMVIPAIYVFSGTAGMSSGSGLIFVSLPKVFESMGVAGNVFGAVFFIIVAFAALTSCVSVMEALVANCMEKFHTSRKKTSFIIGVLAAAASVIVCMGYNVFYFNVTLPNGVNAQLLDVMDYISNSILMPLISLLSCILVGWVIKPQWIIDEMEASGHKFGRKKLYVIMIKYIAPVLMFVLFLQSTGVLGLLG